MSVPADEQRLRDPLAPLREQGPFPTPTHAAQHWYDRAKAAEAERDAAVRGAAELRAKLRDVAELLATEGRPSPMVADALALARAAMEASA